jgi:hypothetical protein
MSVFWLRVLLAALLVAVLLVAAFPLLILLNLASGGTGFGLCMHGLESCRIAYTSGLELMLVLTVTLFALLGVIRLVVRAIRHVERRDEIEEAMRRLSGQV